MEIEEYPGEVGDEEPDDDGDKDHGHLVLGPPAPHVRGLLVREAHSSIFAKGGEGNGRTRMN